MNQFKAKLFVVCCAIGAMGIGCGYSEEEMQVKRDRIDQLTRALTKLEEEHKQLEARFQAAAAENADLSARLQQMGMNVEDSKKSTQDLNSHRGGPARQGAPGPGAARHVPEMVDKFMKMIESGKLRVRIVRGRMVVELAENILFDSGRADLKKEGQTPSRRSRPCSPRSPTATSSSG